MLSCVYSGWMDTGCGLRPPEASALSGIQSFPQAAPGEAGHVLKPSVQGLPTPLFSPALVFLLVLMPVGF